MNVGDVYRLVYCPNVTFKLLKFDKKEKQYTYRFVTGGKADETFTNKQKDVDSAFQFKDWELIKK